MKILKIITLLFILSFISSFKPTVIDWEKYLNETVEKHSQDSLDVYYNAWKADYTPNSSQGINQQLKYIQPTFQLYSKLMEIIVDSGFVSTFYYDYDRKNCFWVNNQLKIQISKDTLGLFDRILTKHHWLSTSEQTKNFSPREQIKFLKVGYLSSDLRQIIASTKDTLVINGFRPQGKSSLIHPISSLSSFAKYYKYATDENNIWKTINEQAKKEIEAHQKKHTSKLVVDTKRRFHQKYRETTRFLASGRYNLKDRVKKIFYQSDLKVAVIVINHGKDGREDCFPYHYLIFEQVDGKWIYCDKVNIKISSCSHTPLSVF